ncbi:MAG: DUF4136 domain-containing protein [Vicinamibacterales bacterium]
MRGLTRLAATVLLTLGLAGCVTMTVNSRLESGVDFTRYRSWDFGAQDGVATGDARLDNNRFFVDALQGAIDTGMSARRFLRAERGQAPDLLVHYHTSVTQRFQVDEPDSTCLGQNCRASVIDYDQGTLVVDVVDRMTGKLLWRGWAQDSVNGLIDNQDRMTEQVRQSVQKIMALFPQTPL